MADQCIHHDRNCSSLTCFWRNTIGNIIWCISTICSDPLMYILSCWPGKKEHVTELVKKKKNFHVKSNKRIRETRNFSFVFFFFCIPSFLVSFTFATVRNKYLVQQLVAVNRSPWPARRKEGVIDMFEARNVRREVSNSFLVGNSHRYNNKKKNIGVPRGVLYPTFN